MPLGLNVGQHQRIRHTLPGLIDLKANAILLALIVAIFYGPAKAATDGPQPGSRYEIIRPLYLMAVYDDLNNRKLSRETARAYLHSTKYYEKSYVAFQSEVPIGTTMTVIGPVQKVWHLPFLANRYSVRLDPDLSRGLDVILELNRGIEGDMEGLNSQLFRPLK